MLNIRAAIGNCTTVNPGVGRVFQKNAMARVIRNVYGAYRASVASGNAEETASAVA